MKMLQCAAPAVAAVFLFACPAVSTSAHADEQPLIWNVARIGGNAYSFRSGIRWDASLPVSAGTEAAIVASREGVLDPAAMPMRLWGNVELRDERLPSATSRMSISRQYEAMTRTSALSLTKTSSWIATPSLDMQSSRSYSARLRGAERVGIVARQTLRLSLPGIRTSMFTEAAMDTAGRSVSGRMGIERSLFRGVTVSASVASRNSGPSASLRASISRKW